MVKNEEMVSPEPFFFLGEIRRQRLQPPLEQPPRAPDLYMDGLAHWVNAPCYWSYLYSCTWREIRLNTDVFSFVFMTFTPTKTSRSQRDELFAKSDFHESIRLTAEVLYLRNSEWRFALDCAEDFRHLCEDKWVIFFYFSDLFVSRSDD